MNQIRKILAIVSAVLIVLIILYMNHDDFSWQANKSNYLGLMACVLNIWALVFLIKEKKS